MSMPFLLNQLSMNVWSIRETDTQSSQSIMYLIVGDEKVLLINTGSGSGNIHLFIKRLEFVKGKSIIVVNTNNHLGQSGGNYLFSTTGKHGLAQHVDCLCASARDVQYTRLMNTANHWQVKTYKITKWLRDQEIIWLGTEEHLRNRVETFWTPGHTPDGLTFFYEFGQRLFIGNLFNQYGDIDLQHEHVNIRDYESSIRHLVLLVNSNPEMDIKYSCSSIEDTNCGNPTLKHFHRFLLMILAGAQKGDQLRLDKGDGYRYENRDRSFRIILSCRTVQDIFDAHRKIEKYV